LQREFETLLSATLTARWRERVGEQAIQTIYERIARRELSPGQAVEAYADLAGSKLP
jgi:hypothetical protein